MNPKFWMILCLALATFAVKGQNSLRYQTKKLKEALALFDLENPTAASDKKALDLFLELSNQQITDRKTAEIATRASQKAGILHQMSGNEESAKKAYFRSLNTIKKYALSDTLKFISHLYLGELYYASFAFDSSYIHLHSSENILSRYLTLPEAGRLYNLMGILYFESGDYRQSIPYFLKAIALRKADHEDDYALQVNLAMAYLQLGEITRAIDLYESLRKRFPGETELLINLAAAYLENKETVSAERLIHQVSHSASHSELHLVHKLSGEVLLQKKDFHAAIKQFDQALKLTPSRKGPVRGDILINLGNAQLQLNQNQNALKSFERAVEALSLNGLASEATPQSKLSTSYLLMLATARKAMTYKKIYAEKPSGAVFQKSVESFESALRIASTLAKNYANETSRLDFSEKIHGYYDAYTDLLLRYGDTKKAFLIADRGKTAVLSMSLSETQKLSESLKNNIRLLTFRKSALLRKQSSQPVNFEKEIAAIDLEISKINRLTEPCGQPSQNEVPDLEKIQKTLSSSELMLSYYEGVDYNGFFMIDRNQFIFWPVKDIPAIKKDIGLISTKLASMHPFDEDDYNKLAILYRRLLGPLEKQFKGKNSILISSDGFLRAFPFEILRDPESRFLVENASVSYLFNSSFLFSKKLTLNDNLLAFAPFINPIKEYESWTLPSSGRELSHLQGRRFSDRLATKKTFLEEIASESPGIFHLATHAKAHELNADLSYIQFYPDNDTLTETRLYLHELQADILSQPLVFLSACESFGKVEIAGEGIRGLSYGFFRAGASGVISSLWNAEDHSTAELSRLFYLYLQKGLRPSEALQQAKVNFLTNPAFARFHNPAFWAHLIHYGFKEENTRRKNVTPALTVTLLVLFLAAAYLTLSGFMKRR